MKPAKSAVLFSLILLMSACKTSTTGLLSNDANEKPPFRIAINIWPGYAYAFIAKEKGFFEKRGVNVELILTKEYINAQEAYKMRELDGIFEVYPDTIIGVEEGYGRKVVYVVDYSNQSDAIIGKSSIREISDLYGKKIGVEGVNTFSHLFALAVLEKNGLYEGDVFIEQVPAQELPKAIEMGTVVAGHTWDPARSQLLNNNYTLLAVAGDVPGIIMDVFSVRSQVIMKRPEDVKSVVYALNDAREFLDQNTEEALSIMALAEGTSIEEMRSGVLGVHMPDVEEMQHIFSNAEDENSLAHIEKQIRTFYVDHGIIQEKKTLPPVFDARFIESMKKDLEQLNKK